MGMGINNRDGESTGMETGMGMGKVRNPGTGKNLIKNFSVISIFMHIFYTVYTLHSCKL
jgi:hypothetical protein